MRKEPENSRKFAVNGGAPEAERTGRPTGEKAEGKRPEAKDRENVLGRLVRSKAGHDREALLVIVGISDENHVLTADGKLRRIEKPKKKKLRHIAVTEFFSEELNEKLLSESPVQDAELRRFIASCVQRMGENTTGKEE